MLKLDRYGLQVRVVQRPGDALLAPVATVFDTAEGGLDPAGPVLVDVHLARLQPGGHAVSTCQVARPNSRCESIITVVGYRDGFSFAIEGDDREDRTEN